MTRWLLSGHNPRESFGISYPITTTFFADFAGRQLEYVVSPLIGGSDQMDLSVPVMVAVNGQIFVNISCLARNVGLAVPFDPTAFGAPKGVVQADHRPRLSTRLLLPFRFLRTYRQVDRDYRRVVPEYRARLIDLYWRMRSCGQDGVTAEDLAAVSQVFAESTAQLMVSCMSLVMFVGMLNMGVVGVVADNAPDLLNLLVGRGTNTALLGERMWALSQVALQCGEETIALLQRGERDVGKYRAIPEAAPLLEAIDRFLHTYGHRAFRYASEFESTRLADQPEMVLLTIGGLLEETESPALRSEAARQASEQALQQRGPLRRGLWRVLLRWGSRLVEQREEIREVMELQNATYGLAARLLSRYYFPGQPQDHLWLYTIDEFLAFGQSDGHKRVTSEVIAERRALLAQYRRQGMLPEMIWYDPGEGEWWAVEGEKSKEPEPLPGDCLQGIPASAGSGPVEGFALVTSNPEEAAERLLSTTGPVVLITEVTDPVWSSLFRRVTAVVTEMGGVVSHPAIVARENGIPAIVGLAGATHLIRDGERVRVDGAAGTVRVLGMTFASRGEEPVRRDT